MGRLDALYARLPVWGQHAAVTAFGAYWHWLRFGGEYHALAHEYRSRDRFDSAQWATWTRKRLTALLVHAATRVPYYRRTWSDEVKRAAAAGHLEAVPLLDKEPLRSNAWDFVRDDLRGRRWVFHTSGSTGTPIATVWNAREIRESLAMREVRSAGWAGVSFRMPRATFSGRMVEPDPLSQGPFHRFNYVERQAYLSAFHLRPDTAAQYVAALRKHRIAWLTGYATSYYHLAEHMLSLGLATPDVRAVITTSEKLTPGMRRVMERAYGCRVFEEYSTVENAVFVTECEAGSLHVSPDAGIVEILDAAGRPCAPGVTGEVVATPLTRWVQPLIRYRLGDMAVWSDTPCPCGRAMPVIQEVAGRLEDVVIGPDGRAMVRFHGIFVDQPHIREGQIVQEALDRIRVKVVVTDGYGHSDEVEVARRIRQRLGPSVQVIVEPVAAIPRTKAGKFRAVVSLLHREP